MRLWSLRCCVTLAKLLRLSEIVPLSVNGANEGARLLGEGSMT